MHPPHGLDLDPELPIPHGHINQIWIGDVDGTEVGVGACKIQWSDDDFRGCVVVIVYPTVAGQHPSSEYYYPSARAENLELRSEPSELRFELRSPEGTAFLFDLRQLSFVS